MKFKHKIDDKITIAERAAVIVGQIKYTVPMPAGKADDAKPNEPAPYYLVEFEDGPARSGPTQGVCVAERLIDGNEAPATTPATPAGVSGAI